MILLIAGIVMMAVALVLLFKPWYVAALPAYCGLCFLHFSDKLPLYPTWVLIFYGAATLMVMGLRYISPKGEPDGQITGNLYLGLGALMGCLLGMIDPRFMLLGTIIGTIIGQIAFSRTPNGKWLLFSKSNFIQYLCAKGLPAIVAVAMMGLAVEGFIFDV